VLSTDGRLLINLVKQRQERFCRITVWDVDSGQRLRSERLDLDGDFSDFDLQVNGSLCAIAAGKQVVAWDVAAGRRVGAILPHDYAVASCRLSADGTQVLTGCLDGVARIWDLQTSKILAASQKQALAIRCVAFSGDGTQFATGCEDGTGRIWSTANATALTAPLAHGAPVTRCFFSPNSRWLATTSGDARSVRSEPIVRAWDASTGEPMFDLPLNLLEGPNSSKPDPGRPLRLQLSVFSRDSRRLHLVLSDGLFATLSLNPDARTSGELLREVVLRSGTRPDGAGGLSTVESDGLVRAFRREQ
jgi:WD40 repeat protein